MRKLEGFENFLRRVMVAEVGRLHICLTLKLPYHCFRRHESVCRVGSVLWAPSCVVLIHLVACSGPLWSHRCFGEGGQLLPQILPYPQNLQWRHSYPLILPKLDLVTQHLNIYFRATQKLIECSLQKMPPGLIHDKLGPMLAVLFWTQSQFWNIPESPCPSPHSTARGRPHRPDMIFDL